MMSILALFTFSLVLTPLAAAAYSSDENIAMPILNSNYSDHENSRILQALNPFYQCDIYPRVCLARGGVAPDCCKKKCVNVVTDNFNCGYCGKKCKAGEACCKGKCVDVLTSKRNCGLCGMKCRYNESCCNGKCKNTYYDKRNCGGCHNKCKKGESCAFGMCNYA